MKRHGLELNGLHYAVREHGRGAPVLLLHGFTGSSADWGGLMAALGDRYRLIAPDLPGHGGSAAPDDPERYGMARVAADLTALLDRMDAARAHLLGYSMGGRLALYLAVSAPERWRSVILESTSPGLADPAEREARRWRDEALADEIEREGIAAFVARWERLPLWASQTAAQKGMLREKRLRNRPVGLANSLRGMGTGVQPSLWERLDAVATPVLVVTGGLDAKFMGIGREMSRRIPAVTVRVVPQTGHAIHVEKPAQFADLISNWLQGSPADLNFSSRS